MIHYSQEQFEGDMIEIARQMTFKKFHPNHIFGISRGGLIPAVFLAQWFDCPVDIIHCSLRDHKKLKIDSLLDMTKEDYVLVFDDIIDSGSTFEKIESQFKKEKGTMIRESMNYRVASLWYNTAQKINPDFYAREINRKDEDRWICFPWENFWVKS